MKQINTIISTTLLIFVCLGLVGCGQEKTEKVEKPEKPQNPAKRLDVVDLKLNDDGSFYFQNIATQKKLKFEACGKGYKDPCPADQLGKARLAYIQDIRVSAVEEQVNSVKCCIQIKTPGSSFKYCEVFKQLNKCPFGKAS